MQNYFNYFTEIEHRFQQRRGSLLLLSTLDWALIETWREAGVPLPAVLRGIDDAFDKYDERAAKDKGKLRKVNGLAWAAQSVMAATEEMHAAAIGGASPDLKEQEDSGFEAQRIAAYLNANADALGATTLPAPANEAVSSIAARLHALAAEATSMKAEELETTLATLEEKLFAALTLIASEEDNVRLREQAARELVPYRGKMNGAQLKQVTQQFLQKRLLEHFKLPRLSLFYMSVQ